MILRNWRRQAKVISIFALVLVVLLALVLGSCDNILEAANRAAGAYAQKDLLAFWFPASLNGGAGLTNDCIGVIKGNNVSVTLPYIPDVTSLVAAFATTGVEVKIGSIVQVNGVTPNDFTNPVTYIVIADDGTTQDYTVNVAVTPNTAKDLTAFCFEAAKNSAVGLTSDCIGVLAETDISVTVPYGTSITSLVATFTTTGEEVRVGATVQESGVTPNNFTDSVLYEVRAADSSTKSYTITVIIGPNTEKELTSFLFKAAPNGAAGLTSDCVGVFTGNDILVKIPYGVSLTSLVATFTTTGEEVRVGATVQESGVTPNNFASPITYVVVAEDSTTQSYNVSITKWETVGYAGFSAGSASHTSIALDSSDTPYVAYRDGASSSKATVMKYEGGSWQVVGVTGFSAGVADDPSLALDSSDTPYVAYQDSASDSKVTVMKYESGSWQVVGNEGFSEHVVLSISLVTDSTDTPYVAYNEIISLQYPQYGAWLKKYESGMWKTVGGDEFNWGVSYLSLALDSADIPYVAFQDMRNDRKASVMKYEGGSWQTVGDTCFSAGEVYDTCIAIDSSDTPYVVYRDYANSEKATVMKLIK